MWSDETGPTRDDEAPASPEETAWPGETETGREPEIAPGDGFALGPEGDSEPGPGDEAGADAVPASEDETSSDEPVGIDDIAARLETEPSEDTDSAVDVEPVEGDVKREEEADEPSGEQGEDLPAEAAAEPTDADEPREPDDAEAGTWALTSEEPSGEQAGPGEIDGSLPREMDLGPEKRVRWWPWALAGLAFVLVTAAAGYAWWFSVARPIVVPDVVGKRAAEATQVLNDVSLSLGGVSETPTDSAPPGTVIGQQPEAGSELKPGAKVSLVVAAAAEQTKIPAVEGVSLDDAARDLAKARLRYLAVESYSETVAAGFVLSQLPSAGVEMPPGAAVALVVSRGMAPAASPVPGVTGLAEADAVRLVESSGFVARVARSLDPSITAGIVLEQRPAASASARQGSIVQILVSQGAGSGPQVPDVQGQTRRTALERLKARGLKASVESVPDATVPRGRVISQMPRAGRSVSAGGSVDLVVSLGDVAMSPVPSVIGTASAAATASAEASGFVGVVVTTEMTGVEHGVVIAQFPLPGTMWSRGYPLVCLVAEPPRP